MDIFSFESCLSRMGGTIYCWWTELTFVVAMIYRRMKTGLGLFSRFPREFVYCSGVRWIKLTCLLL